MKGLMYRWLLAIKRPFTLAMILMFYLVISLMYLAVDETPELVMLDLDSGMPLFMCSLCCTGILMIQLANDRMSGVERYFLSAPVSRRKYFLTAYLFYGAAGLIISLLYVAMFIASVYSKGGSVDPVNILTGYFTILCAVTVFVGAFILTGLSLSRTGGIILAVCVFAVFMAFNIAGNTDPDNNPMVFIIKGLYELYANTNSALLICGLLALSAAVSALIAFISIKLYKRRDIR